MNKASLGDRMKQYESVSKNYLMRRQPVIIRLDGKSFHTFTRGFEKPFDDVLIGAMQQTMLDLCMEIQGCVIGYTQSDEITLVLCDYQKLDTDAWFKYNVQKMVSVTASMATLYFNNEFVRHLLKCHAGNTNKSKPINAYVRSSQKGALFDARVFNVPIEEVNNCLLWRQQDATRNSLQMIAQYLFSRKEILGIDNNKLQDKMFTEKGVNWNDLPVHKKRGCCCIKDSEGNWIIDNDIPIFSQDPSYINSRIVFE